MTNLLIGVALLIVAGSLFLLGRPRQDQEVRAFLRSEANQAIYSIAIVGLGSLGAVLTIVAVASMIA